MTKCSRCESKENMWHTWYKYQDEDICFECFKSVVIPNTQPYFIKHIPSFMDGYPKNVILFNTQKELLREIGLKCKYGKSDNHLMSVEKDNSHWVLGTVYNFDLDLPNYEDLKEVEDD